MTVTLCDSGAVKLKAGSYVSTDLTDANFTQLINQAEAAICSEARINFVDSYSGYSDDVKKILEDAASSHAALHAIAYNLAEYPSTNQAQTMLDLNYTRFKDAMKLLKEKETTDFISEQA